MSTEVRTRPVRERPSLRFSARDLVHTAIFAAILIVLTYAIGMLGVLSPVVWLVVVPVQTVVGGIPVMLFISRIRHAGMFGLFAIVVALFYLVNGNTWIGTVAIVLLGLAGELILWAGRYRSRPSAVGAYTVFGMSFFTPFLPLLVDRDASFTSASWTEMGADYVHAADVLLSPAVIGSLGAAILLAALLGGLLGAATLKKHFVRAGLA
ncbi:MptD family putative ECF transporter S component [Propionicimonas sp.]|uniref:MptD family putative ECF transporter S component n=1 Tax=Propionicimonas sp. TaxID=1955623 RepID=UPI0039E2FDE6